MTGPGIKKSTGQRPQRIGRTLAISLVALLSLCGAVPRAGAAGTQYTLTMADNGTALTVLVGDSIALKLSSSSFYQWDVQLSNPSIFHRPPVALIQGIQGLWDVVGTGQSTISATGTPTCYPQCLAPSIAFSATVVAQAAASPGPGARIPYGSGWYLVGVPQDTTLPVTVYAWDPTAGAYQTVSAGTPLKAGRGYWAYFAAPTTVTLQQPSVSSVQVTAPAGAWVLVGNPSDRSSAAVSGADVLFGWDATGQRYRTITTLQPGEGAWALSAGGATLIVTAGP